VNKIITCAPFSWWNYNRRHDFYALHKPCHSLPNW